MIQVILETLWFFLPAMVANMAPVFVAKYKLLEALNMPVDRGLELRERPLLGPHKTVRGFIIGILSGALIAAMQYFLFNYDFIQELSIVNYSSFLFSIWLGSLLGFGALFGDALKSFFKRQFNIMPGKSWPVLDQIDFVLGAILISWWLVSLSYMHIISAIIIIGVASYAVSVIGVVTNLKKSI